MISFIQKKRHEVSTQGSLTLLAGISFLTLSKYSSKQ